MDQKVINRFWKYVDKTSNPNGCWEWTSSIEKTGYGRFWYKKCITVHRFSFELHKGNIPQGMIVCHACDNRKCVNPDHLWLGTYSDNSNDCVNKNRHARKGPRGETQGQSKLTIVDIIDIRTKQMTSKEYAHKYNVHPVHIRNIWSKKLWKHI